MFKKLNHRYVSLFAVILTLAFTVCQDSYIPTAVSEKTGSITGKVVVTDTDGNHYPGFYNMGFLVSIVGTSFMAVTDVEGDFTINGVPEKNDGYVVVVTKGNYADFFYDNGSVKVNVESGKTFDMGICEIAASDLKIISNDIYIDEDGYLVVNGEKIINDGKDGADGKDGVDGKDGTDGKDGDNGKDGADGKTPYINQKTGTWWIGDEDTGILAAGSRQGEKRGGVVFTFDDAYVDEWYDLSKLLDNTEWKATFFVFKFHNLGSSQIGKLRELQEHGHEIAGHSVNHFSAADYVQDNGITAYLENEIYPMKTQMAEAGFNITSFAYPSGSRSSEIDAELLKEFKIIRGIAGGSGESIEPSKLNCYFQNNKLVYGLGIDFSYDRSIEYIKTIMAYAYISNKVVVFYAHKPMFTIAADYQIKYLTMIELVKFANDINIEFLRFSDLIEDEGDLIKNVNGQSPSAEKSTL